MPWVLRLGPQQFIALMSSSSGFSWYMHPQTLFAPACLSLQGLPVDKACSDAGVRAFPTWVINGRNVEGELTLEALQEELDTPPGQPSPNAVLDDEPEL